MVRRSAEMGKGMNVQTKILVAGVKFMPKFTLFLLKTNFGDFVLLGGSYVTFLQFSQFM